MPRMPATHATVEQVEAGEAELDIPALVAAALGSVESRWFECPAYGKKRRAGAQAAAAEAPTAAEAPLAPEAPTAPEASQGAVEP